MSRHFLRRNVGHAAAFLMGVIFLLAAFSKIGDLLGFEQSVRHVSFIPFWLAGVAVLTIPGLELALGICLLFRFFPRETALIAAGLLVLFLGMGIYSNLAGQGSGCGCFKIQTPTWLELSGWWVVARNLLFLGMVGLIFLGPPAKDHS